MKILLTSLSLLCALTLFSQMDKQLLKDIESIEDQVTAWRHDFHKNPELSTRYFEIARNLPNHLKTFELEFQPWVLIQRFFPTLRATYPENVWLSRTFLSPYPLQKPRTYLKKPK